MTVYEDLVIDEGQTAVGTFNRINVDDAATIVPVFEDGSLMVENYRYAVSTNLLELPGGLVRRNREEGEAKGEGEEGEQPSDTAKRELLEETGYAPDSMEFINWFYTWQGRATQRNFVFMAKGLKKVKFKQKPEEFEYTKVYKVNREQVMQELKDQKCCDYLCSPLWLFYMTMNGNGNLLAIYASCKRNPCFKFTSLLLSWQHN